MFGRTALLAVTAFAVYGQSDVPLSLQEAYVTAATGQVSADRDDRNWAISPGEQLPARRIITTGSDGYARLQLKGGSSFEVFANTRLGFRQNAATAGDLLDVFAGRVRVHLNPGPGQSQQRIFCPTAVITALVPAVVGIAVDEDDVVRIDVMEGQINVQHKFLPRSEPTVVKAVDAILVERNEQISRRLDRGSLYRYTLKPLRDLFSILTPGHSRGGPVEQDQFLASTGVSFAEHWRPLQ